MQVEEFHIVVSMSGKNCVQELKIIWFKTSPYREEERGTWQITSIKGVKPWVLAQTVALFLYL